MVVEMLYKLEKESNEISDDEIYILTLEKEINFLESENHRLNNRIDYYEKIIQEKCDPMIIDRYCD